MLVSACGYAFMYSLMPAKEGTKDLPTEGIEPPSPGSQPDALPTELRGLLESNNSNANP